MRKSKNIIFFTVISPSAMSGMMEINMTGSGVIYELGLFKVWMHTDDCHTYQKIWEIHISLYNKSTTYLLAKLILLSVLHFTIECDISDITGTFFNRLQLAQYRVYNRIYLIEFHWHGAIFLTDISAEL